MWFYVKVDIPLHSPAVSPTDTLKIEFDSGQDVTVAELYEFLKQFGYFYPKYKLYWHKRELSNGTVLQDILSDGDILNLNDPPFLGGLLVGSLVGGAIGYGVAKSNSK